MNHHGLFIVKRRTQRIHHHPIKVGDQGTHDDDGWSCHEFRRCRNVRRRGLGRQGRGWMFARGNPQQRESLVYCMRRGLSVSHNMPPRLAAASCSPALKHVSSCPLTSQLVTGCLKGVAHLAQVCMKYLNALAKDHTSNCRRIRLPNAFQSTAMVTRKGFNTAS